MTSMTPTQPTRYFGAHHAECSGEGRRVGAHLLERRRNLAGAAGHRSAWQYRWVTTWKTLEEKANLQS